MTRSLTIAVVLTAVTLGLPAALAAQSLGVFRWRLDPFCNVVTLTVTQTGSVFRLEGWDDQCSFPQRAPITGTATLNPDGTVGFGFTIVTTPGGLPVHVDARVSPSTLSGPWTDSAGNAGAFTFGAGPASGTVRPPATVNFLPSPFSFLPEGGFAARGTGGTGAIPASGSGVRMMWYPQEAAFRAGGVQGRQWDPGNVGFGSAAFGGDTSASGQYGFAAGNASAAIGPFSTALGLHAVASAYAATAIGQDTTASGLGSLAIGQGTTASAPMSLAGGFGTVASGSNSVVMGTIGSRASGIAALAVGANALASGDYSRSLGWDTVSSGVSSTAIGVGTQSAGEASFALGTFANTSVAGAGSFVFGDRSTVGGGGGGRVTASSPNQFLVRATGGVAFYTNAGLTAGLQLAPSGSQWLGVSDVNMKEHFRDLDPGELLDKIAVLPVTEWSYKAQDASIRHIGPMAQDFRAAFGLGEDPLRIGTTDADGVALATIKALEARTRADNERLTRENDELRARVTRLEALLERK